MDIKEVKDLIQDILHSDISEFELEHTGTRLKLRRGFSNDGTLPAGTVPAPPSAQPRVSVAREAAPPPVRPKEEEMESELHLVTSPIVGTFYRAPSPTTEPYIRIGSKVEEGSILCIVEAMKLMNEIPSDVAGEIVSIFVENGSPVEFGQKLFAIRPI